MLVLSLGQARPAVAERSVAMALSGQCPDSAAVVEALAHVLPGVAIVDAHAWTAGLVVVSDDSERYRVEIAGAVREFVDPQRHCEDRAFKVAVVAALALAPPTIAARVPLVANPAVALPRRAPSSTLAVQLDTGGVFDAAPGDLGGRINVGLDARLALGWSDLQVVIGGAVVPPMTLQLIEGRARVQRVPIDVALRGRVARDRIAAVAELGPRFTVQTSDGVDVMESVHAVRLESAARVASRVEVWPTRTYGAYLQLQGIYVPRPSRFTLPDLGEVGRMPSLWVGASLGLAILMR